MTDKPKFEVPEYFDRFDQEEINNILEYSHDVYIANKARELSKRDDYGGQFGKEPDFYDGLRGVTVCHIYEELDENPHNKDDMDLAKDFATNLNRDRGRMNALMYALMAFRDEENHDACIFIRNRFQEMNKIMNQLRRRNPTDEERKLIDGFQAKTADWNWWYEQDKKAVYYETEQYVHGNNQIIIEDDPIKEKTSCTTTTD